MGSKPSKQEPVAQPAALMPPQQTPVAAAAGAGGTPPKPSQPPAADTGVTKAVQPVLVEISGNVPSAPAAAVASQPIDALAESGGGDFGFLAMLAGGKTDGVGSETPPGFRDKQSNWGSAGTQGLCVNFP